MENEPGQYIECDRLGPCWERGEKPLKDQGLGDWGLREGTGAGKCHRLYMKMGDSYQEGGKLLAPGEASIHIGKRSWKTEVKRQATGGQIGGSGIIPGQAWISGTVSRGPVRGVSEAF